MRTNYDDLDSNNVLNYISKYEESPHGWDVNKNLDGGGVCKHQSMCTLYIIIYRYIHCLLSVVSTCI